MNQAKVPVDGDKKEPQICVIEVSMNFLYEAMSKGLFIIFILHYNPKGLLMVYRNTIQTFTVSIKVIIQKL